ncbi:hypothetical protein CC79DRAFT_1361122 [Sarocladium strictum]
MDLDGNVPKALVDAGLPADSVPDFITGLTSGTGFDKIKGATEAVIADGTRAYKQANADAYSTVFLVSIAFTCIALIGAFFLPDIDKLLSDKVATTLHKGRKDQRRSVLKENKV